MTIGIGAYGPKAGLAVFEALRAVEAVGTGAIGGFATFAAIGAEGTLYRHQTQRGGSRTLFIEGETTGVRPPDLVANAVAAGVISSGPERPEPLTQFLAAAEAGGLVTGHRLPNGPTRDGQPLNIAALQRLLAGAAAQEAVDAVIDENPKADVGLLAVDLRGGVYARNSDRVKHRPDLGHARREDRSRSIAVEVLHNAIRPFPVVAELAASVAFDTMFGPPIPDGTIVIPAGVPVVLGERNAVHCSDELVATKVETTDPVMVSGRQVGAAVYLHSRVYVGSRCLGVTMFEPITTVIDGIIRELSGQNSVRMGYLREPE